MALERKEIFVYAHWGGIEAPFLIGSLYATPSRGKEIFSFEYDKGWLQSDYAQIIDPDLQLFKGAQYSMMRNPISVFFWIPHLIDGDEY
ncbi:hypothetical protein [Aquimarina muelleri]|uniref:HipA N-terminal subdomain 1 domain-containing protein n=1 Tax=Aquimarina muelleri TaxID=279356 RepID=A0A918JX64_9FLAO|nr:hypothetical protein [Aquimarina muelleri]GGX26753.1 hypothetical protein GCM10007384_29900 [Aquimarina muelleri]